MYQVNMIKGTMTQLLGTYSSREEAEAAIAPHAALGYWDRYEIVAK